MQTVKLNPAVRVSEEWRSGTGKVLTAGDEVKVQGRPGRWSFRAAVHRADGRVDLELVGLSKPYTGKQAYARPEDCSRRAKAPLPKEATTARQQWGAYLVDALADDEGEPQEPLALAPNVEQLACEECSQEWTRERVRGRKPKRCPDCRAR